MVGGTFAFSEAEKKRVLSFQIGGGLNVAKNVHVPVNFLETELTETVAKQHIE